MNRLTKAVALGAALTLGNQAANAAISNGDLVLGFSSGTATVDYVLDLGSASGLSSSSITHFGGSLSASEFTTGGTFPGGVIGVNVGALFGIGNNAGVGDLAGLSVFRTGANAVGVAGTEAVPATPSGGLNVTLAANAGNSISLGTVDKTFTAQSDNLAAGTFANNLGLSPSATINGSTFSLDLFETTRLAPSGRTTPASPFAYLGQLEFDFSGANPVVDFVPAGFGVPEPGSLSLLAGAGVVALLARRSSRSRNS